jgi:adhesin transport system membrane fusion protein
MLNISNNKIDRKAITRKYSAFGKVREKNVFGQIFRIMVIAFVIGFTALFLPWTQNVRANGKLTALNPEDREQTIHTLISGRVEKWFVKEGQLVNAGDTILYISEIKAEYLDPDIVGRSGVQTKAKENAQGAYVNKAQALANQIDALRKSQVLKLEQAKNYVIQYELKVVSDSIELETAIINLDIAEKQFERQQTLYGQGLKSLTELEQRKQKLQESVNKKMSALNKFGASKAELTNAKITLDNLANEFAEKIAKAQSDRMSALSSGYEAAGEVSKLQIQEENYTRRSKFYYITAPQDGFVTKALTMGIGESVKEGQALFTFIPSDYDLAVEIYIEPIDLPLIHEGSHIQLQFDGWPALVFGGWPNLSQGTFTGRVSSFDKAASPNGKFRVLILPDPETPDWPKILRLGTGVYGIALLNDVPIWYELWRNLNGFPPEFYYGPDGKSIIESEKHKKAIK